MAKHNPKLNPCRPYLTPDIQQGISLETKRLVAGQLISSGWHNRRVRKTLELSGRQLRKAINNLKRPANV
jgi:hypothetical protein